MLLINKATKAIEDQPWRTANWLGKNWLEVPERLREKALDSVPYCDLVIETKTETILKPVIPEETLVETAGDPSAEFVEENIEYEVLTDIIALEKPAEEDSESPDSPAKMAALEQQVTDLQMALCDMYEAMEVMMS